MNKCIIASDSFKGTLSSKEIAELFESVFKEKFPNVLLEKVVLADGGENTLEVFTNAFPNGAIHYLNVCGPNFNNVNAKYFTNNDFAVIELAEASGLSLVNKKNPLNTTTFGVGELIKYAYLKGIRKFYVALGGSSTNDGGCGLLSALGIKFLDKNNNRFIPVGGTLHNITNIDMSNLLVKDAKFTILSDVINPMFGPNGAAYIFAKQKGATNEDTKLLDKNLQYLNELFIQTTNKDVSRIPGAGSAGAVAAGMLALLDSKIVSGIDTILDIINFDEIIKGSDYIFTGEGKFDRQSLNGKLISGVLDRANRQNIKVICICGKNALKEKSNDIFYRIIETNTKGLNFYQIKEKASKLYLEAVKDALNII